MEMKIFNQNHIVSIRTIKTKYVTYGKDSTYKKGSYMIKLTFVNNEVFEKHFHYENKMNEWISEHIQEQYNYFKIKE